MTCFVGVPLFVACILCIGDLVLDEKGIWRTKATQNGKTIEISVDVQGDVVASG